MKKYFDPMFGRGGDARLELEWQLLTGTELELEAAQQMGQHQLRLNEGKPLSNADC